MDTGEVEIFVARQVELLKEMSEMTLALFDQARAADRAELGLDDAVESADLQADWAGFLNEHPELRADDVALDDESVVTLLGRHSPSVVLEERRGRATWRRSCTGRSATRIHSGGPGSVA